MPDPTAHGDVPQDPDVRDPDHGPQFEHGTLDVRKYLKALAGGATTALGAVLWTAAAGATDWRVYAGAAASGFAAGSGIVYAVPNRG